MVASYCSRFAVLAAGLVALASCQPNARETVDASAGDVMAPADTVVDVAAGTVAQVDASHRLGSNATYAYPVGPAGGDLCAFNYPNPNVCGITGSGSSFGVVPGNMHWVQVSTGAPSITQNQQGNSSAPNSMTIAPQAPGAGAGTTANGTPGSLLLNLATPVSTGVEAAVNVNRGGNLYTSQGADPSAPTTYASLYLGPSIAPGSTNYVILSDSTNTLFNCPLNSGSVFFQVGGTAHGTWTANGLQLFASSASFGGGTGVLGITNASVVPTSNPTSAGIVYENTGELSHRGSGGAITEVASPGTGTINTQTASFLRRDAYLRTASTSATTIWTSPAIASSHVMTIDAICSSIDTTTLANSAGARTACSFVNSAGTVSQLGSTTSVYNHHYTTPPACTISGTTVLLQVTAVAVNNTDSQCHVEVNSD